MKKLTAENLDKLNQNGEKECKNCIKVGMSTCGLAAGAEEIYNTLSAEIKAKKIPIDVTKCGCVGMCFAEPMIEVILDGMPNILYGGVTIEVAHQIVKEHLINKKLIHDHIYAINAQR